MFVKNSEIQSVQMAEGVKRKIMGYGGKLMVVEVKFEKGAVAALHSHPHEQVSYVVKGKFEFTVGDKKEVLSQGDSVYIPSGVQHQVVAVEEGVVTDSFTPVREDFLKS